MASPLFLGSPGSTPPRGSLISGSYYSAQYNIQNYSAPNGQHFERFGGTGIIAGPASPAGWNVFALTYNGTTATLYLNGSSVASAAVSTQFIDPSSNPSPLTTIGGAGPDGGEGNDFFGQIAALRVYDTAMSPASIASLSAQLAQTYTSPEPSTLVLAGIAGVLMLFWRRRSK